MYMRPSQIWIHWERQGNRVTCKYCGNSQLKHAGKCANHLASCSKFKKANRAQSSTEASLQDMTEPGSSQESRGSEVADSEAVSSAVATTSRPKRKRQSLVYFVSKMTRSEFESTKELLAMVFYTGHIPFLVIENHYLHELFITLTKSS